MNTPSKLERRLVTQPYDFSIQDLVAKIHDKDIIIQPDFQRRYHWNVPNEEKPSRLIESLILNIPIPILYFAETDTLKYEVIDGHQRLATFKRFLEDDFRLEGLEIRSDINGKKYSELKEFDRDAIRKRSVRAIVILNESDDRVKFEIFERLNSGSVQLTPQELRNAIYDGPLNNLLHELANLELLKNHLKFQRVADQQNMSYEEMILRFFAFHNQGLDIKRDMNNLKFILNEFMKEYRNISEETYREWRDLFVTTLEKIIKYLGEKAFVRFTKGKGWNAASSSRSLVDAEMLAFAKAKQIKPTPDELVQKLEKLMSEDEDFIKRTIARGRDVKSLNVRANKILALLQ